MAAVALVHLVTRIRGSAQVDHEIEVLSVLDELDAPDRRAKVIGRERQQVRSDRSVGPFELVDELLVGASLFDVGTSIHDQRNP